MSFALDRYLGTLFSGCEAGHFPCRSGSRCFKLDEFCNGVPDCMDDCSDEKMYFCNFNDVYPAPDYRLYPQ